ncbi:MULTISPECIES: tyrosine recombinase XerC [unclassified Nocardioides]|uniref:site-specific integrase n=1 Tax=unclassified Nocardioides TaxID=2615069 RepID=UPI0007029F7D|nr:MULTISPECIES: site-specific integrase [unclassified Nocardioides]KRC53930.1 hypothetical protein ASE19_07570 [Nocardioides sp. Root79]KRC71266.1 hypothetical protein ASE20_09985 [Nocardioides sp. Root240]
MTRKKQVARVAEGITDRWYKASGDRSARYGHTGPAGSPDPNRYLARWKPPHAKEQSKTFATVGDAQRWLRHQKTAHDNGEWIRPDRANVKLADVHAEWWPQWQVRGASGRPLKPSTIAGYADLWRLLVEPTFGGRPVSAIRTGAISKWASQLSADGVSASRIRQAHRVLSLVLDHAVHDDRLRINPAKGARLPAERARSTRAAITAAQVLELADAVAVAQGAENPAYRTMVRLLGFTGLRLGEVSALRVRDLDLDRLEAGARAPAVTVRATLSDINGRLIEGTPKSGRTRVVPLPPDLVPELRDVAKGRKPGDRVFTSPRGDDLRPSNFRRRYWKPAAASIGKPDLVIHELRHTAVSLAVEAGVSLAQIANMVGHADPAITAKVYSHHFEDQLGSVGAALNGPLSAALSESRRNDGPGLAAV